MTTYQISRNGQVYGPYTLDDLRRYVASGNVMAGDFALPKDGSAWVTVAEVLGGLEAPALLEAGAVVSAETPSAPMPPAYAGPFAGATEVTGQYLFFSVSPVKFCVMSACTFGIYQLYWAYKNWSIYQDQVDGHIMPWARAIFAGIWNFPLFSRVRDKAIEREIAVPWNPIVLGIAVVLLSFSSRLPHAWSALVFVSFLAYLPVVVTIERLNTLDEPAVRLPLNSQFSAWNIVGVVVGGILLLLSLLGLIISG